MIKYLTDQLDGIDVAGVNERGAKQTKGNPGKTNRGGTRGGNGWRQVAYKCKYVTYMPGIPRSREASFPASARERWGRVGGM